MSTEALAWVKKDRTVRDAYDRLVLFMLADEADSSTGYAFPSLETIAAVTCMQKSTVIDVLERLEAQEVLLVRRPEVRGRGHFNQYVLVMGRDPATLEHCWHHKGARPVTRRKTATAPKKKPVTAPAAGTDPPSTGDPHPPKGLAAPTVLSDKKGSGKGRRTVGKGLAPPTGPYPGPCPRGDDAARIASPARDPRLQQLRQAVTAAAADVVWDLDDGQAAMVLAQVELCGLQALVDEAVLCVRAKGPPRTARAWITPWELLTPPPLAVDVDRPLPPACGACDGHRGGNRFVVDDEDRPIRPCPSCHPSVVFAGSF